MAHKTLINGTAYSIIGGKSMVSGTSYSIKGGRTCIGGTGYNISFIDPTPMADTAMLYSDGSFVFQIGDDVESGKTLVSSYSGFENLVIKPQWSDKISMFTSVRFDEKIAPTSMYSWFDGARNMISNIGNFSNLDIDNVINMSNTYNGCTNLTCSPVCGRNVVNMHGTYRGCYKLTGAPICGDNVINMSNTYLACSNLTGSPVCGKNVVNMHGTYDACLNLTGSPVCGDNVIDMSSAYWHCCNLTGSPVCGDNVTNMKSAYRECYNLTGSPACGDKVTDMSDAYRECYNLTGSPVCGKNVTRMLHTYKECYNLTGSPVCGDNVTDMTEAYNGCTNLTGSPVCGRNVTDMRCAYEGCVNIGRNAYFHSTTIYDAYQCFLYKNNSRRLNLYVPANSTTNTTVHYNNTSSLVGANITWTDAGSYQYNTTYNIYIYPVANVALKYEVNENGMAVGGGSIA